MKTNEELLLMPPNELNSYLAEQRENGFIGLTQSQRAFALTFVESTNLVEAATAGGITPDTGRKWLRHPVVACFINYLNQQKEHYSLINASFIEVQYLDLFSKLMGEQEVSMVDKDGRAFQGKRFHSSEAVSCLRDLAKISGHYKEDNSLNIKVTGELSPEMADVINRALDAKF